MTCPDANILTDYLQGKLRSQMQEQVEAHIDACVECRELLSDLIKSSLIKPLSELGASTQMPGEVKQVVTRQPRPYQLQREVARGGQARIWIAYDEEMGREVALKELLPHKAREDLQAQPPTPVAHTIRAAARFIREARITGQLQHPGIVPVYEIGERPDGGTFYTMQLVLGQTLDQAISSCQNLAQRLRLLKHFLDLCQTLAYAHSRGVIHRDIKPQNVMTGRFGETVLLDWGLAKVKGQEALIQSTASPNAPAAPPDCAMETMDGTAVGTPAYMSPEQAAGKIEQIDERSDVYGLGAVLYQLLTGRPPHKEKSLTQVLEAVRQARHPEIRQLCPQAPAELCAICEKAMAPDPGDRYQKAAQLAQEIEAFLTGGMVGAYEYRLWDLFRRFVRRHRLALLASGVLVLALLVSLWWSGYQRSMEVMEKVEHLKQQALVLEQRRAAQKKTRQEAQDAFERDDHRNGETKWRADTFLRSQLLSAYEELWSGLRPWWEEAGEPGKNLRRQVIRELVVLDESLGLMEKARSYRELLGPGDGDDNLQRWFKEPARLTVVSLPEGAHLEMVRFDQDANGLLMQQPPRTLGRTPLANLELDPGSVLLLATLEGFDPVRYPVLLEPGEERTLSLPLPVKGTVPEGMVYVPPGEFVVGSNEQEEIRRYTGALPQYRSYIEGFLTSKTEVTFEEYWPFWRQLSRSDRERFGLRGPYRWTVGPRGLPILAFGAERRAWGEPFEFPNCDDCSLQDWRKWPVAVNWDSAEAFARWKSQQPQAAGNRLVYRLPTEREWEKAARGADGRTYACGEKLPEDAAATLATHGQMFAGTHQVGSFPKGRSVFGLDDTSGNAWEWVRIRAGNEASAVALKGGSFNEPPLLATLTTRVKGEAVYPAQATGFRLATSLPRVDPCPLDSPLPSQAVVQNAQARTCRDEAARAENRADYPRARSLVLRWQELVQAAHLGESVEMAETESALGNLCFRQGQYAQSMEHYQRALAIRQKASGEENGDIAKSYNSMANVQMILGRYEEALALCEKALFIRRKAFGEASLEAAASYWSQAVIFRRMGSLDQSLAAGKKALEVNLKVLGENHLDTAGILGNLGNTYSDRGEFDQALAVNQRALAIRRLIVGERHPDTAVSYDNLGSTYYDSSQYDRALEYHQQGLQIRLKLLGPDHFDTALSWANVGNDFLAKEKGEEALTHYHRALRVFSSVLGPGHPYTLELMKLIGHAHFQNRARAKALEQYQLVIKQAEADPSLIKKGIAVSALLLDQAQAYSAMGQVEQAKAWFEKAWQKGQQECAQEDKACADAAVARCSAGTCDEQAWALVQKGLASSPKQRDLLEAKAFALLTRGQEKEAKEIYCQLKSMGLLSHPASWSRIKTHCP